VGEGAPARVLSVFPNMPPCNPNQNREKIRAFRLIRVSHLALPAAGRRIGNDGSVRCKKDLLPSMDSPQPYPTRGQVQSCPPTIGSGDNCQMANKIVVGSGGDAGSNSRRSE